MNEQVQRVNQKINNFLVTEDVDNNLFFCNIEVLCQLIGIFMNSFTDDLFGDYEYPDFSKATKMNLIEKINLVKSFYNKVGINFDLDKYINDGTIDFENYVGEEYNKKSDYVFDGINTYDNSKKIVNTPNNGILTDCYVLVHELSHLREQPDLKRGQVNHFFGEGLAIAEELIFFDYSSDLGYEYESNEMKRLMYYTLSFMAKETYLMLKMFLVFLEMGNISLSSYTYYCEDSSDYLSNIEYLDQLEDINIYDRLLHVLGGILGTYMYSMYLKDNSYIDNIILLHDRINDSSIFECLKLMGLNDINEEDYEKISSSLEEVKSKILIKSSL